MRPQARIFLHCLCCTDSSKEREREESLVSQKKGGGGRQPKLKRGKRGRKEGRKEKKALQGYGLCSLIGQTAGREEEEIVGARERREEKEGSMDARREKAAWAEINSLFITSQNPVWACQRAEPAAHNGLPPNVCQGWNFDEYSQHFASFFLGLVT